MGKKNFPTTADCHPALSVMFPTSFFDSDNGYVRQLAGNYLNPLSCKNVFSYDFLHKCPISDVYHPVVHMVDMCKNDSNFTKICRNNILSTDLDCFRQEKRESGLKWVCRPIHRP